MASENGYDVNDALRDPSKVFDEPIDVATSAALSTEAKRKILRQWELDARQLQVAEEESMAGGEPAMLARVRDALRRLEGEPAAAPRTDPKLG